MKLFVAALITACLVAVAAYSNGTNLTTAVLSVVGFLVLIVWIAWVFN